MEAPKRSKVLVEDPIKSYPQGAQESGRHLFDNLLIHGDNQLALKAVKGEFAGNVKCIYVDPPYNTGQAFEHYDDGLEHSHWLGQMEKRFVAMQPLLSEEGSLFVHLDDNELDYCKVLLDQVFGRGNFLGRITIDARSPSSFSTVNPGVFKASEYLLWYAKDRARFEQKSARVASRPDYAYNLWLTNPEDPFDQWKCSPLLDAYENPSIRKAGKRDSRHPRKKLDKFDQFIVENASRICRLAAISDRGAGAATVDLKYRSKEAPSVVHRLKREKYDDVYVLNGQQLIFYSKNVVELDGCPQASRFLTNIWTDLAWEGIAKEGGVTLPKGKKPERLIKRCLELATHPGDLVLDAFLGSGTTAAVAHKMGRRWIGMERGDHCETHCIPRLTRVIDGTDPSGITESVHWKGGGGFRYYTLDRDVEQEELF